MCVSVICVTNYLLRDAKTIMIEIAYTRQQSDKNIFLYLIWQVCIEQKDKAIPCTAQNMEL